MTLQYQAKLREFIGSIINVSNKFDPPIGVIIRHQDDAPAVSQEMPPGTGIIKINNHSIDALDLARKSLANGQGVLFECRKVPDQTVERWLRELKKKAFPVAPRTWLVLAMTPEIFNEAAIGASVDYYCNLTR